MICTVLTLEFSQDRRVTITWDNRRSGQGKKRTGCGSGFPQPPILDISRPASWRQSGRQLMPPYRATLIELIEGEVAHAVYLKLHLMEQPDR